MSEKVDLTEVIALSDKLAIAQERVIVSLDGVSQSIDTVNTMESFSGTAAISAKEYFTDFHQIMIAAFQELFLEIHNTLKRHILSTKRKLLTEVFIRLIRLLRILIKPLLMFLI